MSETSLAPKLTAYDKRVLKAIPASMDRELPAASIWQIGEALKEEDLLSLRLVLNGLLDFGYIGLDRSYRRGCGGYWRTSKGDKEVAP